MASNQLWKEYKLTDLAFYLNGFGFKPSDWSTDGVRIIRIEQLNNPEGYYDHFQGPIPDSNSIDDGDLIFSWSATLKVAIWRHGKAVLNQHLFKVLPKPGFDKLYLFYLLDFHMPALSGGSHGSTMKHIKRGELERYLVRAPKLLDQARISNLISVVDENIHQSNALISKYQQIKAGLMQDLFTRGVTSDGKLRPSREEAPELYKKSSIGWIPNNWNAKTLGDILKQHGGYLQTGPFGSQLHAGEYQIEGVPVVMPQDINDGIIGTEQIARIHTRRAEDLSKHRIRKGDIVIARRGDLSRAAPISHREQDWLCGTGCFLLRLGHSSMNYLFAAYAYQQHFIQRQIDATAVGTTMPSLNNSVMSALVFPFCDVNEQLQIVSQLKAVERTILTFKESLFASTQLKQGLMQDLLTGRVQVNIPIPSPSE